MHTRKDTDWKVAALAGLLAALWLALALTGCRPPKGPGETWDKALAISCATDSVREAWPRAYPQVMACLLNVMTTPLSCLDAIPAAAHVGVDTIACIVRGVDKEAAMQGEANPADVASIRKAERARAWLDYRGVRFAEP